MVDFLTKVYSNENFVIYLFGAIAVLTILFVILVISGRKDKKKESKKIEEKPNNLEDTVIIPNSEINPTVNSVLNADIDSKELEKTITLEPITEDISTNINTNDKVEEIKTKEVEPVALSTEINPVPSAEPTPEVEPIPVVNNIVEETPKIPEPVDLNSLINSEPTEVKEEIAPVTLETIAEEPVTEDIPSSTVESDTFDPFKTQSIPVAVDTPVFSEVKTTPIVNNQFSSVNVSEPKDLFDFTEAVEPKNEVPKEEIKDISDDDLPKLKTEVESSESSATPNNLGETYTIK